MNMASSRGRTALAVVLPIAALVLLGLAVFIPYQLQQNRINDLTKQISSLKEQLAEKTISPTTTTSTPPTKEAYLYTSSKGVKMMVYVPVANAKVSSPVAVVGEIPGNWSFEASFPIRIEDSSGKVVAQTAAQVLGNWMTTDLVPFSATLIFDSTPTGNGKLILQKDNPSGLAENDDSASIPIVFQ